jgi:hypothetical protein
VQEDTAYTGAHDGTVAADGLLTLASLGDIDSVASFDAIANLNAMGGIQPSGTYDFSTGLDLGAVTSVRLTASVQGYAVLVQDEIDSRGADLDDWLDFDATAGANGDAWVEVRDTDDNPAGSPTWSDWRRLDAAEFEARAFEFRARLSVRDSSFNIRVSRLRVSAAAIA